MRRKLATATAAAELDPAYARNIDALKAVQPADLEPGDIEARLGSSWIPASDIKEFIGGAARHIVHATSASAHAAPIATWTVEIDGGEKYNVANTTTHGTARFRASELVEQALNGRVPTAYDEHEDGTRVINQQETARRPRKTAAAEGSLPGMDLGRRPARRAAGQRVQRPLQQSAPAQLRRLAPELCRA